MPYNEYIAHRIRELLLHISLPIEEKRMFGGLCFMVDGKMCIGVMKDKIMCRIHPDMEETALKKRDCRPMDFTRRPMKGFIYVEEEGIRTPKELAYWVDLCLAYNPLAKATKKKTPNQKNNLS